MYSLMAAHGAWCMKNGAAMAAAGLASLGLESAARAPDVAPHESITANFGLLRGLQMARARAYSQTLAQMPGKLKQDGGGGDGGGDGGRRRCDGLRVTPRLQRPRRVRQVREDSIHVAAARWMCRANSAATPSAVSVAAGAVLQIAWHLCPGM